MKSKKHRKETYPVRRKPSKADAAEYDYHLPVLLTQAADYLITDLNGIYIDGTLGGGGHTAEILRRLGDGGKLLAFDKDSEAISHCLEKFSAEIALNDKSRLVINNECFSGACSIKGIEAHANGLLLDLGVSSWQLDHNSRGIAYRELAGLDMRFGSIGETAEDLLHAATEEELERLLRTFGEEPFARVIARRIVQKRRAFALKTTFDLRDAVCESVPQHLQSKSLSRVFQAIRIAVNNELQILQETITNFVPRLAAGGRIVIISYHSLEDRIVKNSFKELSLNKQEIGFNGEIINKVPEMKILTKKPITPSPDELKLNPRSRSAKMRVAEKI